MQIYNLNARDKRLLSLCLALVAFWIIFIIGAVICLIYCVQLVSLGIENTAAYALVSVAVVVGISAVFAAITYTVFYLARYKNKCYSSAYDGKNFIIRDGDTTYTFTREDIISHTKTSIPRLIGKHDLSVRVRRYAVDGDVVVGVAQFTLIHLCEKGFREQTIKACGIR